MYDSFSLTKLVLNLGYLLPFVIKSIHSKSFGGFLFNSYKSFTQVSDLDFKPFEHTL